jgi:hypothetical protein
MRRAGALLVLLALTAKPAAPAAPAAPAELTPVVREHTVGVHIGGIAWPATLTKDLVSGLTNTLLIHVALFSDSRELDQKTAVIAIKYDLWEETFALTVTVNDAVILARSDETQQQIEAFLGGLELPQLFAASEVPKDGSATLRVDMLLNPIDRERLEAIKKWVIDNNTSIPADTSGFSDKRVRNSRSNELFNKIFEQYAQGADVAAAWKESLASKPFKIAEVGR